MVASFGIIAAAFLLTLQPVFSDTAANDILVRQTETDTTTVITFILATIPSSCTSTCQPTSDTTCTTQQCLCSTTFSNALQRCAQCVVDANVANYAQTDADATVSGYDDGCAAAGFSIPGATSGDSNDFTTRLDGGSNTAGSNTAATNTATTAKTATTSGTSTPAPKAGAASRISTSMLGVMMITVALGAISLL